MFLIQHFVSASMYVYTYQSNIVCVIIFVCGFDSTACIYSTSRNISVFHCITKAKLCVFDDSCPRVWTSGGCVLQGEGSEDRCPSKTSVWKTNGALLISSRN